MAVEDMISFQFLQKALRQFGFIVREKNDCDTEELRIFQSSLTVVSLSLSSPVDGLFCCYGMTSYGIVLP